MYIATTDKPYVYVPDNFTNYELLEENGLKETLIEKTATIGEKLSIRRFAKVSGEGD